MLDYGEYKRIAENHSGTMLEIVNLLIGEVLHLEGCLLAAQAHLSDEGTELMLKLEKMRLEDD